MPSEKANPFVEILRFINVKYLQRFITKNKVNNGTELRTNQNKQNKEEEIPQKLLKVLLDEQFKDDNL